MKFRHGFVTNSSSSSFVAYGIKYNGEMPSDDFCIKLYDDMNQRNYIDKEVLLETDAEKVRYMHEYIEEYGISEVLWDTNLTGLRLWGSHGGFLGVELIDIMERHPDRPMKDAPKIVEKELLEVFGENLKHVSIEYTEEFYYDY